MLLYAKSNTASNKDKEEFTLVSKKVKQKPIKIKGVADTAIERLFKDKDKGVSFI